MSRLPALGDDVAMQVIAVPGSGNLVDRLALARALVTALLLLLAGVALLWLCLGTPLISGFIPLGRPSTLEIASGIVIWGFAIVVPAAFLIMGLARLAAVLEVVAASRPRRVTPHLASALGADHLAATGLVLPGGRRIHELVMGPFGIVVLGDMPPASITRHVGSRWEIRGDRGRWVPIEDPVQRTSRDAERVRSWLASDDRDFLVRIYAVIVTERANVERSATCAVIAPADLAGWLEALPVQRGLTTERREQLIELVLRVAAVR